MKTPYLALCALLLMIGLSVGCDRQEHPAPTVAKPVVVTTLYPLYEFARQLAGDRMEVQLLLPPGVEPHHFEPTPDDLARIHRAALFVYIGPFLEPWAERVIAGVDRQKVRVVAAAEKVKLLPAPSHGGHDHDHDHHAGAAASDPHVWLDFVADQTMVTTLLDALVAADPAGAEQYRQRAGELKRQLAELDQRYRNGLANCDNRVLLHGGHAAFGYLAHRYHLTYQSAAGVTAELEATPQRLAQLVQQVRQHKVQAVFMEQLDSPRVADTLARETGATVRRLHGAHNVGKDERQRGVTFIGLMEENLTQLQAGLGCRN
ncbi:MAG: metal ABC transporter solute-binding protein, Zn/Mn family [Geobacter sp.]|jgi:zinc transport system substrate-binding protein|uniref:metal ABC transporter solute-binding protein, Zn/Mn family n=1 Tax=Trichlorobacter sp. TaxID=2911007 RepID=UPI002A36FF84|nr:zinc ABC transporter substrate-binding protein [Trichlorobacter sp.]MDY0384927.1 zinc ABC transporter substrate-binding protein [Trichlorobacter sp.]